MKLLNKVKRLFCKHDWICLHFNCKYRKKEWCGDIGKIHGLALCWKCYFRDVKCKKYGKIKINEYSKHINNR